MARQQQLVIVATVTLFALASISVEASSFHLDCSNAHAGASLSTLKSICHLDDRLYHGTKAGDNFLFKLDTLEACTCALINHEIVWASLMTHENEVLNVAIKQFIEQWDAMEKEKRDDDNLAPQREKNVMFKGREGTRRYLWFRLDNILREANDELDYERILDLIRENFAKVYYDPGTFKAKFNTERMARSQKLTSLISDICREITIKFATPFAPILDRLAEMAENNHLFYTLTAYNENLYKLRLNTRTCLYLAEKGHLDS